jgi:hypothetical protein
MLQNILRQNKSNRGEIVESDCGRRLKGENWAEMAMGQKLDPRFEGSRGDRALFIFW